MLASSLSVYCADLKTIPTSFCGMLLEIQPCFKSIKQIQFSILELNDCKSYRATSYNYSSYFKLDSIAEKKQDHHILDLKIFAIAQRDVYILLTSTTCISNDSSSYELGMC